MGVQSTVLAPGAVLRDTHDEQVKSTHYGARLGFMPLLTSYGIVGTFLNLSAPQFPHL